MTIGSEKKGILLLNLGTPDAPEPEAVGRYLKQFLMDKWVIDIPAAIRWFFVNVLIVPKRKFASAEAYQTIWTERGSPLLFHLKDLQEKLAPRFAGTPVEIAMRYGNPSIEAGLKSLADNGAEDIFVFSLYPQYAESSTRSSEEECQRVAKKLGLKAKLRFMPAYYDHPEFISTYAELLRGKIAAEKPDHVLLSYHGLPERHVKRTDLSGGQHCLMSPNCCAWMTDANRNCYRAQCYATSRALAKALGLKESDYSVSFQSRLGRTPWIRPFTDEVLKELPSKGVKRLMVACPSFAADCLETLEEIVGRGSEEFKQSGGAEYHVSECPNSHPRWVEAVERMIREQFPV